MGSSVHNKVLLSKNASAIDIHEFKSEAYGFYKDVKMIEEEYKKFLEER